MTQKSILIIGAGVAGLCTGIYGQMNGYQTRIIEKHKIPGGLVTAWRRKGYLIDLCVHWLPGSGPGLFLNRYWNEIGLLEGRKFLQHDRYGVYHASDGRTVNFYCDPDRLEEHWLSLAPEDATVIHELADGVRLGIRFRPPEMEKYEASTLAWMKFIFSMMPLVKDVQKNSKLTVKELVDRFQNPLLRKALLNLFEPEFSVFYMIYSQMGFLYKNQAAYPLGGSLPLALTLEKRYKQLGGIVHYRRCVENIMVENECAVGVRLEDSSEQRADVVISAADGYNTVYKLLEGNYIDKETRHRYEHWAPFRSMIYIGAGVNRTFPDYPFSVEGNSFELQKPVVIAGEEQKVLPIRIRNEDPCFAPAGKTVVTSAIFTRHEFWTSFQGDHNAYAAEKENVRRAYLDALEQIWPGISPQVEMVNIATPLTFERMTGNWKGSITGWKMTPDQATAAIPRTLPGLRNFWMVGHWVYPGGGLPSGVSTGREVIFRQCKLDKKTFTIKQAKANY
jgi:phytoene dehydrogenase-like protein